MSWIRVRVRVNVCRWIWQPGSVQIHSWLYKWLKAQKLIRCICFQCKADKSRADSDSRGRRALPQQPPEAWSLKPACCSFQRAVHMAHSSGSIETFKALLLKGQTFVLWQKLWPEVLLYSRAPFKIRLLPAKSSFLHLPVNYVSTIVSSLKKHSILDIMDAWCILLLLLPFACGQKVVLSTTTFPPSFFFSTKKSRPHAPEERKVL